MKITFLGTGTSQGVPVIACPCPVCHSADSRDHRLRASVLVCTDEGLNILIDAGPDFRQQMLRHDVDRIDAILITHAHRDHVAGIDDIRPFNYLQHAPLPLYANRAATTSLISDYGYIFAPHPYAGLPEVRLHEVDGPFSIGGQPVVPIAGLHKDMPVLGYRLGPLVYLTDCNHIAGDEVDKMRGCRLLVLGCLRREPHFSHLSLPEALALIADVRPRRALLTHISHEMGFHSEVILPEGVSLAYDGLEVKIES